MELQSDSGDPFDVSAIWRTSLFAKDIGIDSSDLFPEPILDIPGIKLNNPYAPRASLDDELRLPDIDSFGFATLDDISQPLEAEASSDEEQPPAVEDEVGDLWDPDCDFQHPDNTPRFFTWEAFESQTVDRPSPFYLSEAGPAVFDVMLLSRNASAQQDARAIRTDALLNCLFNLGLGRSSVLFHFIEDGKSVVHTVTAEHMTGLSVPLTQAVIDRFTVCGTAVRFIHSFVERTYHSKIAFPALVALANTISSVLATLTIELENRSAESIMQLETLFEHPKLLVEQLKDLTENVSGLRTNTALVSAVYEFLATKDEQSTLLKSINLYILTRASQPWLELVQEWTGMFEQPLLGFEAETDFFAERAPEPEDKTPRTGFAEYLYIQQHMPPFIPESEGEMIFETGNAVRFLRHHHPDHPACSVQRLKLDVPGLEWRFTWDDVERTARKAKDFETSLQDAIKRYGTGEMSRPTSKGEECTKMPDGNVEDTFVDFGNIIEESASMLDTRPATEESQLPHELIDLIASTLDGTTSSHTADTDTFEPPLALSPLLTLFPILRVQAQLVNAVTLRLFFRTHGLRHHLDLQRQYHLFGDGVFLAQLSTALFSPDLRTAERVKGKVRTGATMGLRLGNRTTWPPASSELTLALMDVLSDCYHSSELYLTRDKQVVVTNERKHKDNDLPGQLSFAVRQLPEADIEKVMDPNSLYALDFLRLQYDPPSPIHLVITATSLEKYDQIFKFLCRLLRMMFVVNQLSRTLSSRKARKFRVEAMHVVLTATSYFFETGVRDKWNSFAETLDSIESEMFQEDETHEYGSIVAEGLNHLRKAHEACLDRIMLTLFLRKRHEKVMGLLEEIFAHILEFAVHAEIEDYDVTDLYTEMHAKTQVFLQVCRGLSGKRSKKVTSTPGDELDIERLIVKMDVDGYYEVEAQC